MHVSPSASNPENVERRERAALSLQEGNLWTWAAGAFERGQIDDPARILAAIALARNLDSPALFEASADEEKMGMRRGAVAASAAIVLHFREGRSAEELAWAREVLARAVKVPESRDIFWSSQSIIPWHQSIFAARGLAADIRRNTGDDEARRVLLALVAHPLEVVALSALQEIATLWEHDPKLVWAALQLAFNLCRLEPEPGAPPKGPGDPTHTPERSRAAWLAAADYYDAGNGWSALPLPPPAWIKVERATDSEDGPEFEFGEDDLQNRRDRWTGPPTVWYSQFAAKVLKRVPYEAIFESDARGPLLDFLAGALAWTVAKNAPPWLKKGRRDRESSRLFEWNHDVGDTLGRVAGLLPVTETGERILTPMFELEGDTCSALMAPFVSAYICRYVYDAPTAPQGAVEVLGLCLERLLRYPTFKRSSYRAGEFSGFDEPRLVESLLFVSVERAPGAARYVNGDWSAIGMILPLVDRFVRAAGWAATVMSYFLTLCERAKSAYPAEIYADQILAVIGNGSEPLRGWSGTLIPARIAGLVQVFSARDTPMPHHLGQKLLRVLDLLVDMGDRRSAALQLCESFREITIS
jgi:hypothetical protein